MGRIVSVKKRPYSGLICFVLSAVLFTSPVFAAGSVRVDRVAEQVTGENLKCETAYPHISGLNDKNMQQKLNVAFKEKADVVRTEAKYEAKSGNVNAKMDFKVMRNQDGVMSLVMKESIVAGKGEKLTQTGVTINTVTGRRYFISDLFIDNADYVSTLSAQIKSKIESSQLSVKGFDKISENADY